MSKVHPALDTLADPFCFRNAAVGSRLGGRVPCPGPYSKVQRCPVAGHPSLRLDVFGLGGPDSAVTIPAVAVFQGLDVPGQLLLLPDGGVEFDPLDQPYRDLLGVLPKQTDLEEAVSSLLGLL